MKVRFIFKSSSGKRQTHEKRLPVLLGRSDAPEVKLHVGRDSVSRRHCEFFLGDDGMVHVRDLESTNGTHLGSRRLPPRVATPVPSGATLRVGDLSFRVEYAVGGPGAAAAPHDSETIPIDEAPVAAGEDGPVLEAADGPAGPAEAGSPAAAGEEDAFGFLAAGEPAADADVWPGENPPEEAGPDEGLNEFFKGLS